MKLIDYLNIQIEIFSPLLLRMPFILMIAFAITGCIINKHVHAGSVSHISTSTELDCSQYKHPYSLRDYTVFGVRVKQVAPFINGARSQEIAATAIRKLDSLDQQVEAWKAGSGACFGKSEYGKQVANKYLWVKEEIDKKRTEIEEKLLKVNARNKALEAERSNFEQWRKNNKSHLIRNVGGMKLEIIWIALRDIFGHPAMNTEIFIEATNTTTSKILMPKNHRIWGYEIGSDVGGQLPIGVSLTDSFGNKYKLTSITPSFLGNEAKGIRPGQIVTFKISFGDAPLKSSKLVRLEIDTATFGQKTESVFEIPIEAFHYEAQ